MKLSRLQYILKIKKKKNGKNCDYQVKLVQIKPKWKHLTSVLCNDKAWHPSIYYAHHQTVLKITFMWYKDF